MQDRIPTKPGRIKLTKEGASSPEYFYMEMADEPATGNEGTPLDKAHLLTDTTIAEILAKCGTSPSDINTALSAINSKALKFKTGSFTGRNSATQVILNFSTLPSTGQSITDIGFEPQILILMGATLPTTYSGGNYMIRRNYTEVLRRGETSHMMFWIKPGYSGYDERHYADSTANIYSGGMDSITWSGNTVSWTGWWTRNVHYGRDSEVDGYTYSLFDNYNLSGKTYYYTAIGL